ncbi:FAD-dependent oxidoreductase [Neorhizobium sp. DAR64860/K0K1]|uniref:FAD-dependent oxidoreductase n=1 Tax=Neorhizobium sp. DAR64860/K0K1 TaxID=3421955 RepID=UPI003D2C73FD
MKANKDRILIVGAGPVGLVAACCLSQAGIPVTVVETSRDLPSDLRASTFHPPTLDMLDRFGIGEKLVERGLICPQWQFRDRQEGVIATFDLGVLAGETNHPYRLQCEQWKMSEELRGLIEADSQIEMIYGAKAVDVRQDDDNVTLTIEYADGGRTELAGRYLIGCDGARSNIRKALDISFDGLTIPEIFLSMSTSFKFDEAIEDLTSIAYLTDPNEWAVLLRTPSLWRVLLPTDPNQTEEEIKSPETMERRLQALCPKPGTYDIVHATAYRVHQRVAATYVAGRIFLAGDAAHLNNPLGGMGMNGGIHDAVNLCDKLVDVWTGKAPLEITERYNRQRRKVAIETVQEQSLRNRRMMAENDPTARAAYHDEMRRTVEDPAALKNFLMRSSMIQSLRDLESVA